MKTKQTSLPDFLDLRETYYDANEKKHVSYAVTRALEGSLISSLAEVVSGLLITMLQLKAQRQQMSLPTQNHISFFSLKNRCAERTNGRKDYVSGTAKVLPMAMENIIPSCPTCGKKMVYYSSDVFSEHYVCPGCDQFLAVERRAGFFAKSPFKPRYPPIHS
jgi:predicted RNA-binding Zn-ribbon protein involved in translation (DUF1610 family)